MVAKKLLNIILHVHCMSCYQIRCVGNENDERNYVTCTYAMKMFLALITIGYSQWRTERGVGVFNPPPEILKSLQNRAKLNLIVKTAKNC